MAESNEIAPRLKAVSEEHKRAVEYKLTGDMTQEQIGIAMGKSRVTINKWFQKPEVKAYVADFKEKLAKSTENTFLTNINAISEEMKRLATEAKSEAVRVKAAELVYKLLGLTKQTAEVNVKHIHLSIQNWLKDETDSQLPQLTSPKNGRRIDSKEVDAILEERDFV